MQSVSLFEDSVSFKQWAFEQESNPTKRNQANYVNDDDDDIDDDDAPPLLSGVCGQDVLHDQEVVRWGGPRAIQLGSCIPSRYRR